MGRRLEKSNSVASHIFVEFLNFFPHLRLGDILLVDDTPKTSIILEIVQEKK